MLYDLDVSEVKELLTYYLDTLSTNNHSLGWFFNNYNDLYNRFAEHNAASEREAKIREATRIRTEEWKRRTGN